MSGAGVQSEPLAPAAAGADLLSLYREMARVRAFNDEAILLQRKGVLPAFAPCTGQEAAQVGSAAALDITVDFAFPTYRELGAMLALGVPPLGLLAHHRGFADGGLFDSAQAHVAPINAVVGGTALHAVGWAMGARLDGAGGCAIAYFGEGASSQGEVHEAMNFAAVYRAPVVFFCQNNRWAISVPASRQVGGGSVAARGAGYGMPAVEVDGNDVEAVLAATAAAVARARAGEGPSLIEAATYRLGPHATSDDPRRYRSEEEERRWEEEAPLRRAERALLESGRADAAALAAIAESVAAEVAAVREELALLEAPSFESQLDLAYRATPPILRERGRAWLAEVGDV